MALCIVTLRGTFVSMLVYIYISMRSLFELRCLTNAPSLCQLRPWLASVDVFGCVSHLLCVLLHSGEAVGCETSVECQGFLRNRGVCLRESLGLRWSTVVRR